MTSKVLRSVGHLDGTLEVEFVAGSVYRYFDVPAETFRALLRADSPGAFFNRHIGHRFRFREISRP